MTYSIWGENLFGQVQHEAAYVCSPTLWRECDHLFAANWAQVIFRHISDDRSYRPRGAYSQGTPLVRADDDLDRNKSGWHRTSHPSRLETKVDLEKTHFLGHDSFLAFHDPSNGKVCSIGCLVEPRRADGIDRCVTEQSFESVEMNIHGGLVAVCKEQDSDHYEYRFYPSLPSLLHPTPVSPSTNPPGYHLLSLPSPSFLTQTPTLISAPTTDHFTLLLSPSQTVLTFSPSKDNRFGQLGIPPSSSLHNFSWTHVESLDGLYITRLEGAYALTQDRVLYNVATGDMVDFLDREGEGQIEGVRINCLAAGSGWAVASDQKGNLWVCTDGKAPCFGSNDTKGHFEKVVSPPLRGRKIDNLLATRSTCYLSHD
ncbi:hypothetical protein MVLG_06146 [Microbotryum lychnidis-dioicae p1A1 Lamole]|uniref:SMP-30/Gluconolactonase/LRE-like region domain-containing protein n=1 Tax=Microbotryum lychnidis-dioicae (strain p1A1 Lamole / MvSl-1064) TaxID=683840 RepID=U5HGD6_USTV1|nr:hypothetical protein MVLG_06146 [Microbotryum lychnidis-dioicae p1A1 Lamole]|eukprot:KDE03385.1 hypothetical protein MVLG_06146 [Microbotryum lychnidis-dioicae p1A1 Lamole]